MFGSLYPERLHRRVKLGILDASNLFTFSPFIFLFYDGCAMKNCTAPNPLSRDSPLPFWCCWLFPISTSYLEYTCLHPCHKGQIESRSCLLLSALHCHSSPTNPPCSMARLCPLLFPTPFHKTYLPHGLYYTIIPLSHREYTGLAKTSSPAHADEGGVVVGPW
jgi:hypothetical protein